MLHELTDILNRAYEGGYFTDEELLGEEHRPFGIQPRKLQEKCRAFLGRRVSILLYNGKARPFLVYADRGPL